MEKQTNKVIEISGLKWIGMNIIMSQYILIGYYHFLHDYIFAIRRFVKLLIYVDLNGFRDFCFIKLQLHKLHH